MSENEAVAKQIQKPPAGSFDTTNVRWLFSSTNSFDIPDLQPINFQPSDDRGATLPRWLAPYRTRVRNVTEAAQGCLHFYLDDYRFETVWLRPIQSLPGLAHFGTVITPDFSLCTNWPIAAQIWSVYRSRWCGAYWQSQGLRVVPSIGWSTPKSYDFCFLGVPKGSAVSIATTGLGRGTRSKKALRFFRLGFEAMLDRLQPETILCYGKLEDELMLLAASVGTTVVEYPTRWEGLIAAGRSPRQKASNKQIVGETLNGKTWRK